MCQTDLERKNAGLWAWLPGQDRTVQWSAHLVHLHAAWKQIWRLPKLHVIHDVFALFIANFSNVGKAIAVNHQFGNGLVCTVPTIYGDLEDGLLLLYPLWFWQNSPIITPRSARNCAHARSGQCVPTLESWAGLPLLRRPYPKGHVYTVCELESNRIS